MAGAAPDSATIAFNYGQTVEFTHEVVQEDGTSIPWADYVVSFSYASEWGGRTSFDQTDAQGRLTVIPDNDAYTVSMVPRSLRPGSYTFEVNATHTATGKVLSLLDGTITIYGEDD